MEWLYWTQPGPAVPYKLTGGENDK